jgi:hypothetical protein
MKISKILFFTIMNLLIVTSAASASDFDWARNFNIRAKVDPSGFRASLATRFKIGNADVNVVLGDVTNPSDAYILCRLGEMSNQPMNRVLERYRANKNKGWGVLAKSLGIKPGSSDFKALKQGQDLYNDKGKGNNTGSKGKGNKGKKGKGKVKK